MASTLLERVRVWQHAKTALEIAKETERLARDAIISIDFADRTEGTNSLLLPDGRVLKCVAKTNYEVDKDKVDAAIGKLRKIGNEGSFIADRLFSTKWVVSVGELRKLDPQYRRVADKAIVLKTATPTIEVVEPRTSS